MTTAIPTKITLKFRVKSDCEQWELPLLRSGKIQMTRIKCKPPIKEGIRWHLEIQGDEEECDRVLERFASGNSDIEHLPTKSYDKGDRVLFCSPPNNFYPSKLTGNLERSNGLSIEGTIVGRGGEMSAEPCVTVDIGTAIISTSPRFVVLLEKASPEVRQKLNAPKFVWRKEETDMNTRESLCFGDKFTGILLFSPEFDWQRRELNAVEKPVILYQIKENEYVRFFASDHTPIAYFEDFGTAKESEQVKRLKNQL